MQLFFFLKYLEFVVRTVIAARTLAADVYHAHDLETLPIGYILSKLKKKPLIYDSHELYIDTVKHHPIARKIWYRIEKLLAPRTFINILTTESRGKVFAERYNVKMPTIISNCQYYKEIVKQNIFRDNLPISAKNKIILYQGGVSPQKGADVLLDIMEYLQDVVLIIMGQGEYKNILRDKVETIKNSDKVFILDPVPWDVLSNYTASADIGVSFVQNICLNNYLMLSNKLFEYLAAGLPVVFPDFPESRKVILENKVGLVVDETDPKAISEAIEYILSTPKVYKEMSRNAKRIVKDNYNWDIESEKLVNIYNSVAN